MVSDMMTAEQLKGSILQLAMQGKLVEQRPEEGTGEELYVEITRERHRLVKEGKIKKEKEQSDKNEEVPFDIPESWKWAKLNDIVAKTIKRGKSPKYTQKSNTLVFAQKCNTKAGHIDLSLCLFLDENQLSKYPEEEFMVNEDIVINSTGNGTLGRVGVYRDSDNPERIPLVPDSHVTVIRCSKYMYVRYVYYCLKYYQPYMEKLGSGSTNQTELGAGVLKELSFPIPPLAEQKRIVAKIEELIPFVEQYAAASTKLNTLNATFPEMMTKSILQEAVQGKLVPQDPNDEPASLLLKKITEEKKRLIKEGKIKKQKPIPEITEDEIPFDIPESWEWVRFGDIYTMSNGIAKRAGTTGEFIGVLRLADLSEGVIDTSSVRKIMLTDKEQQAYLLKRNDLIMIRVNGSKGKVGTAFVYDHIEKTAYCDHLFRARSIGENICPKYIALVFNTAIIRNTFKNEIKTTAGQNTISQESMKNVLIPLPPMSEQERIVDRVSEVLPSISLLRE